MIFSPFDIVVVPFPFTDLDTAKRRPALILSRTSFIAQTNHSVCAMITSAKHSAWAGDTTIIDLKSTGLTHASVVRFKIFTIDNRFILKHVGVLSARDCNAVMQNLKMVIHSA